MSAPLPRRAPRPWLAALLSLLPGLGHLYAKGWRAGLLVAAAFIAVGVVLAWAMVRAPGAPLNVVLPFVTLAAFRVWVVVDAWRVARRQAAGWASGGRITLAGVAFAALSIASSMANERALHAWLGEAFRIPGGAMEPTIRIGDYLMVEPLHGRAPRRDEIVAHRRDGKPFLHRVVGVPGDTLAMHERVLWRNGRPAREPWVARDVEDVDPAAPEMRWQLAHRAPAATPDSLPPSRNNWGPLVVPAGHVFVLGDNRDNSLDSRYVGFIPTARVIGRPTRVYFSQDPERGTVRWRRIGQDIQGQ